MAKVSDNQTLYTVLGQVTDFQSRALPSLIVRIYDRDMRSEELLNETVTDREGKYETTWKHSQLAGRGRRTADLVIKVLTPEKKTVLYASDMDNIRFNAGEREEINITLKQPIQAERVEYDFILKEVLFLADKVAVTDLQENEKNRDISFLSKETDIAFEKIEHLVVAQRLEAESKIEAAFFYALLRKNTLLKNDWSKSVRVRLRIDVDTAILPLLYDAALADTKIIQQDVAAAAKEMLVSDKIAKETKKYIEQLHRYAAKAKDYYENEYPKKALDIITHFVKDDKIGEMGKLIQENKNDLTGFLKKISEVSFFKSNGKATDAKVTAALGELLGFNAHIIDSVKTRHNITKPEDIRQLAALNKADWKAALTVIQIEGKTLDEKIVDLHASSLVRKMEKAFPTVAFAAQLGREKKSVLKNQTEISTFLGQNEDFDLQNTNIDLFIKSKKKPPPQYEALREELKSVQRVFKLVPHYGKTNALMQHKIHSAQSIVAVGETRFVEEISPKAGIPKTEARAIFRRAERTNTAAMLIVGELQDTLRAMDIAAIETSGVAMKLKKVAADFPNLKTLFQLTDMCACEHCRSVYSPAAYLVEILQFLDKRSVTDLTTNTTAHLAKDVLFERRPDLGEIDLGCENANTPVPYIDLVCELLEAQISPDLGIGYIGNLATLPNPLTGQISATLLAALEIAKIPVTANAQIFGTEISDSTIGAPYYLRDKKAVCKIVENSPSNYTVFQLRQTLSTAEELAAAPQYVNPSVYTLLSTQNYAFKLPFDLNHTEAKAYFTRFGIERATLMQDFQVAAVPTDAAIAAEQLNLTDAERLLIVTPKANLADQQLIWNAPGGTVLNFMKRVDHFLDKTGLTYTAVDLLLSLKFIDPAKNLFIKNDDLSCDTAKKEIANLDVAALDRIHRLLRWQKKTGWTLQVLDEIIQQSPLGNGQLNDSCLVHAANLLKLSENTGIKVVELLGFYGTMPHEILRASTTEPLYQQVFLNKAKNGVIDDLLKPEGVDGIKLLSTVLNSISVCLQISEQDLNLLLPLLPNGNLDFSNLSYLFAASRLMRKLKLKAEDFVALRQLTGIDFQNAPATTLAFVHAAALAKSLPLKLADMKFMLWHEAANQVDREIKDEKIEILLKKLQAEYQKTFIATKSIFDTGLSADVQKEALQIQLSIIDGVGEDKVKTVLALIDREWTSVAAAKTFIDNTLGNLFDTTAIKNSIDTLAIVPIGIDFSNESKLVIKALMDSIAEYQFQKTKKEVLAQNLTTTFKADETLVNIILKYAKLKQPAPGTDLLSDLLLSDSLIDKVNTIPVLPAITVGAFLSQYQSLRLLHKMLPFIKAFKLDNTAIDWHFQYNADLNLTWFLWDEIPYQIGQNRVSYQRFTDFAEMVNRSKTLTPVPNPADAENPVSFLSVIDLLRTGSTATRIQFLEKIALLIGFEKPDVDAVDSHLFPVWNLNNYRLVANWEKVETCLEHLRTLGSTVPKVKDFIKPILTDAEVKTLRLTLKSRYDEDTWLGTLKEIMDAIRPQKRNALVAYLLAENPDFKNENDLYDYFLVDVEMEACMPSSRIVQAHGTVQLFVQRCLMGLEPKAAAYIEPQSATDTHYDKGWEQWKWMKNYRVWEANRKVFLYTENWIEAELRDDKSFLFTELENELLQNELTNFTAEEALIKYLEKLDNIAFLEVMATWYQSDIKTMHVFARTKGGDPAIYYYRRFEKERYWTPWEKVELDITGDHLIAFVRNNRLTLAWPVFSEEADAKQKAKVPATSDQGKEVDSDKPKRKLKIQLAISEFANKKWQPKKISQDGILTPSVPSNTESDFIRDKYYLTYFNIPSVKSIAINSVICLFSIEDRGAEIEGLASQTLNGVFNVAGCKGYPELLFQGKTPIPDFLPGFLDTNLVSQRYKEINPHPKDELSVKNGVRFFEFIELLKNTPGIFRISYPHQFTVIDGVSLLVQLFFQLLYNDNANSNLKLHGRDKKNMLKIPMGTLLPYFMEDSSHAYVLIPGLYEKEKGEPKRTASDIMKLIEDIIALLKKYYAKYLENPAQDLQVLLQALVADNEYQKIIAEIKIYTQLHYGEQFKNVYHPLVCALRTLLYRDGIPALMRRETQLQQTAFDFQNHYTPSGYVAKPYPVENIDFDSDGSYSGYNWELFFHVPFLLATRLTKNQRFEEAMTWFHYIFNPTGALSGTTPQKFWVTKPFYQYQSSDYISQRIDTLLYKIADPATPERAELEFAIDEWRIKPFRPHVVARFRPVAYQKAVLMKYVDNLMEWGDYLFRQDTTESIVQATQMYILADKLLGEKPRTIPPLVKPPYETYNQMEAKLDAFGNALIDLENILPDLSSLPEGGAELPAAPTTLSMLYFCIPQNDKMLEYWERVADRLFKIRHCQNIDGVERSLALFAPPIDPGMLVRAAASGLDISSVLAGINAPTPYYRFNVLSQKATELVNEVRGLGASLLQALEKKDAEAMSLLRSELEIKVLNAVKDMKKLQIKESTEQIEVLKRTKKVTEERQRYYASIQKISSKEQLNLDKLSESQGYQKDSQIVRTVAGALALIPEFHLGAAGFGGSPKVVMQLGGSAISKATNIAADILNILGSVAAYEANRASILGGYDRRFDDWKLQQRLANLELNSIDKQIVAADIRKEIAETDLKNHDLQIENAKKTDEFMRTKYTNKELYEWMMGQISSVYFRSYQLAHDFAKKAERSYRFELGNDDTFISYGYWDSMKKGLQSADHLLHDIKRMETSYLDKNKREYEITKHISLALLDPLALVRLRATGVCDFDVPEALFDMDHAGQYFRRTKSVSISLPCIAGPYTSVSAKLSLVKNKYRKNVNTAAGYPEAVGNDERFVYNIGTIQSIATSNAQNDSGIFELNFRDERYLPFEGTGAISSWRLELPKKDLSQFDYDTISDVIVHIKYTSREGGSTVRGLAETDLITQLEDIKQELGQTGLHIALNMKHDLPNQWHLLKQNGTVNVLLDKSRLPYMAQMLSTTTIAQVMFIAKVKNNPVSFSVNVDAASTNLARIDAWKMCRGTHSSIALDTAFALSVASNQLSNLEELMMVVKYIF